MKPREIKMMFCDTLACRTLLGFVDAGGISADTAALAPPLLMASHNPRLDEIRAERCSQSERSSCDHDI